MVRTNMARIALVISIIVTLTCVVTFLGTEDDYIIAKGESAEHIIRSIQMNPFNYDEDYKTDEQKELETKRSICVIAGIASVVVAVFSVVVIKSEDGGNEYTTNMK